MNTEKLKGFVDRGQSAQAAVDEMIGGANGTKTTDEIEELKQQWLADPAWDIEHTEGFEAHEQELTAFHEIHQMVWDIAAFKRVETECNRLGCSPAMFSRLKFMETQIDSLQREVNRLRGFDG